ncbi:uncharacterized protein L201_002524 [Kwoniella dendrophila CBS 6074]|uniref:Uncharacterized protein n=1 Tax=Kwoniella dendrophila CBS 6074 TaxID=1295534 RepID=A0AAX4JRW6_9TREE
MSLERQNRFCKALLPTSKDLENRRILFLEGNKKGLYTNESSEHRVDDVKNQDGVGNVANNIRENEANFDKIISRLTIDHSEMLEHLSLPKGTTSLQDPLRLTDQDVETYANNLKLTKNLFETGSKIYKGWDNTTDTATSGDNASGFNALGQTSFQHTLNAYKRAAGINLYNDAVQDMKKNVFSNHHSADDSSLKNMKEEEDKDEIEDNCAQRDPREEWLKEMAVAGLSSYLRFRKLSLNAVTSIRSALKERFDQDNKVRSKVSNSATRKKAQKSKKLMYPETYIKFEKNCESLIKTIERSFPADPSIAIHMEERLDSLIETVEQSQGVEADDFKSAIQHEHIMHLSGFRPRDSINKRMVDGDEKFLLLQTTGDQLSSMIYTLLRETETDHKGNLENSISYSRDRERERLKFQAMVQKAEELVYDPKIIEDIKDRLQKTSYSMDLSQQHSTAYANLKNVSSDISEYNGELNTIYKAYLSQISMKYLASCESSACTDDASSGTRKSLNDGLKNMAKDAIRDDETRKKYRDLLLKSKTYDQAKEKIEKSEKLFNDTIHDCLQSVEAVDRYSQEMYRNERYTDNNDIRYKLIADLIWNKSQLDSHDLTSLVKPNHSSLELKSSLMSRNERKKASTRYHKLHAKLNEIIKKDNNPRLVNLADVEAYLTQDFPELDDSESQDVNAIESEQDVQHIHGEDTALETGNEDSHTEESTQSVGGQTKYKSWADLFK